MSIAVDIKNNRASLKGRKEQVTYHIDPTISKRLAKAIEVKQLTSLANAKGETIILLTRQLSKPTAMGKGYCGAGFEDYLLLTQITKEKITLLDNIALQSCLNSISVFSNRGDDNLGAGLTLKEDGSIRYRLVDDEYDTQRILTIKHMRFDIKISPDKNIEKQ